MITFQDVYDISNQHHQLSRVKHPEDYSLIPNYTEILTLRDKCNCLQVSLGGNGTRCLITKEYLNPSLSYVHRLFTCDIFLFGSITVYFLTKPVDHLALLSLHLLTSDKNGGSGKIKLNSVLQDELLNNCTLIEVNPSSNHILINYVKRINASLLLNEALSVQ